MTRAGLGHDLAGGFARPLAPNQEVVLATAETGPGIPREPPGSRSRDNATTGASFVVGAIAPIVPYRFLGTTAGLVLSVPLTLGTLFLAGVVKARSAGEHWFGSGAEVAGLAGATALPAYVVGTVLPNALGSTSAG